MARKESLEKIISCLKSSTFHVITALLAGVAAIGVIVLIEEPERFLPGFVVTVVISLLFFARDSLFSGS
ncbi:MAG: hypothetical protein ACFFD4_22880 [Candidatus Odinarchaeota archaeon]